MLLGATGPLAHERDRLAGGEPDAGRQWIGGDGAAVLVRPWGIDAFDRGDRAAADSATGSWLVYAGHLIPDGATLADVAPATAARALLDRLGERGLDALAAFDGNFAVVWYDGRRRRLQLVRDRFGIESLFYAALGRSVLFGSRLRDLRRTGALSGGISGQGLAEYLTYCHVPGDATLDAGVQKVPAGGWIEIDPSTGATSLGRWYRLSFADPWTFGETGIQDGFRDRLERAVVRRLGEAPAGLFVSGGMDSSSALTFARRHLDGPIRTFGFRCAGASFDESTYARALAETLGTEHSEVEFGELQALEEQHLAAEMDVPGCDIGINVGTWILGRAASGRVSYVLTGDGGDELWGSHPVYAAQKLLRHYERLPMPRFVNRALLAAAARVPDSDRKRDLRVALKRLLPADGLPRELGPYRWRAYYVRRDFETLLTPEAASLVRSADPYRSVIDAYDGYDGPDDGLSPHLYNDYVTASGFYFARLRLLRRFGIEARLPFYDRELVEFGARIPAHLKLEGVERTKRLFRQAMEGVLPDVINHRRDKLGHSVPVKNWMRADGPVARWIEELCAPSVIERRGIFRADAVRRLLDEHRTRRHNHSHRLWAIVFLEAWLRRNIDAGTPGPAVAASAGTPA